MVSEVKGEYFIAQGIKYEPELRSIKKKQGGLLRPVFEAISNSWEAIIERFGVEKLAEGRIEIDFFVQSKLLAARDVGYEFEKIRVADNGIGMVDEGFERIKQLRDNGKGVANKGTGRVQYIHSFDLTTLTSVYEDEGSYKERIIRLSKSEEYISRNSILWYSFPIKSDKQDVGCVTEFYQPLLSHESEEFTGLMPCKVKDAILTHFICSFARHRTAMPQIRIRRYVDRNLDDECSITVEDVLVPDKEEKMQIAYSAISSEGKIIRSENKETFKLTSFVAEKERIATNALYLVGKEEIANKIKLNDLKAKDDIDGKRYLFFLSGKYLDDRDDDARGNIVLMKRKDFRSRAEELSFDDEDAEQILWEDVEEDVNERISSMYSCIAAKKEAQNEVIDDLKEMFILNEDDVNKIRKRVKNSDTPCEILEKVYDLEAKRNAMADAQIRQQIQLLVSLNPKDENYKETLEDKAQELSALLPARNKHLLSQYVCRRKIVLDLLDKLIKKSREEENAVDEAMLHNLFISRNSEDVKNSDLWLIDEEYMYFRGVSDKRLDCASINGELLLKEQLTPEEEEYKLRQYSDISKLQNQGNRRPDVLLFPEEGKCMIFEFKAPDIDVSDHLKQIHRYATLIHNLSKDKFLCDKFYGYLIGENIDYDAVTDVEPRFKLSPTMECLYNPHEPIKGKFQRAEAELYTEILKYSDLLKRARRRNQIFSDLLFNNTAVCGGSCHAS